MLCSVSGEPSLEDHPDNCKALTPLVFFDAEGDEGDARDQASSPEPYTEDFSVENLQKQEQSGQKDTEEEIASLLIDLKTKPKSSAKEGEEDDARDQASSPEPYTDSKDFSVGPLQEQSDQNDLKRLLEEQMANLPETQRAAREATIGEAGSLQLGYDALQEFWTQRPSLWLKSFIKKEQKWVAVPSDQAWKDHYTAGKKYLFALVDPLAKPKKTYCEGRRIFTLDSYHAIGLVLPPSMDASILTEMLKNVAQAPFITCSPPINLRTFFGHFFDHFDEKHASSIEHDFRKNAQKTQVKNYDASAAKLVWELLAFFDDEGMRRLCKNMLSEGFSTVPFDSEAHDVVVTHESSEGAGDQVDLVQDVKISSQEEDSLVQKAEEDSLVQEVKLSDSFILAKKTKKKEEKKGQPKKSKKEKREEREKALMEANSCAVGYCLRFSTSLEQSNVILSKKLLPLLKTLPCFAENTSLLQEDLRLFVNKNPTLVGAADLVLVKERGDAYDFSLLEQTSFQNIFLPDRLLVFREDNIIDSCYYILETLQTLQKKAFVSEGSLFHYVVLVITTISSLPDHVFVLCSPQNIPDHEKTTPFQFDNQNIATLQMVASGGSGVFYW